MRSASTTPSPFIFSPRAIIVLATVFTAFAVHGQPVPPPASGGAGVAAPQSAQPNAPASSPTSSMGLAIHPIVRSIPESATMSVPDWIKPGTRLAYLGGMGTVNDAAGALKRVEDPNGPLTDADGTRFRIGDPIGTPTGNSWYHIIDVVAVEPGVVVLVNGGYHLGHGGVGTQSPLSTDAVLSHPSGCDFFLHPSLMSKIPQPTFNGMDVLRYSMNHDNGNQYQCVHFVLANTPEHRQSMAYDATSGVNLTYTSIVKSQGQAFKPMGGEISQTTNSSQSLSILRFISARLLELPWRGQTMPAWAKTMKRARYEGAITYAGPAYVNLPDWRVITTAEFTTKHVGETFTAYDLTVTQQAPMQQPQHAPTKTSVVGPASIGGLWMDPKSLAEFKQGQIFDSDPTTGIQVGVEYIGTSNANRPIVVIAAANQVFKISCVYDATEGRLVGFTRQDYEQLTGNTQTLQMNLQSMN